ncbi:MAG TPA: nucleotidyltransferase domain-containing protein [Syntrophomonadaceae bacterium]|nr:nucleotidyltransferase domain-containing protein [Syntrophomonadaceae bacterium]
MLSQEEIITASADYLERQPDIAAAYLFGSLVLGTFRPGSDVDVAILYTPDAGNKFDRFERRLYHEIALEEILHRPVQVIDLEQAPHPLQYQIRKYGRLVVEKDKKRRVDFEVRSRRMYFDMQRFYRLHKAALFKRLGVDHG